MDDIFISYARSTEAAANQIAEALRERGFSVWRDDQLLAHRAYADAIEERLMGAKAVVVIWSPDAVKSQWVRAEANVGRAAGTLVQVRLAEVVLPLPFNEIHCADLTGWTAAAETPGWQTVIASVEALVGRPTAVKPQSAPLSAQSPAQPLLAVLAFDNLSNDTEMTYFSDGISEEILHTVSRSKGLRVIGKASSFQFRGPEKSTRRVVAELKATHVLDGSVRRAGNQLRISAQLVDTATQATLWSERYDRALSDIFALQDEIAAAIAAALDAHFEPHRAAKVINPAAYDLFLQVRAIYSQDSTNVDRARCVSLLEQTVAIAPNFPPAWAQLALFHGFSLPKTSDDEGDMVRPVALREAERALSLDPRCGPAFSALALLKPAFSDYAEKLRLAKEGYLLARNEPTVVHLYAGALLAVGRSREACAIFDEVVERDPSSPYSLAVRAYFYNAAGDTDLSLRMADSVVAQFPQSTYAKYMLASMTKAAAYEAPRDFGPTAERLDHVRARFAACYPVVDLVHAARAACLGDVDLAYDKLVEAVSEDRPIAFDTSPSGRGFSRAYTSVGLFVAPFKHFRRDPRFAELCVRLGLYDYWQQNDVAPDCVAEVAPFYDLMAECARIAAAADHAVDTVPLARQGTA